MVSHFDSSGNLIWAQTYVRPNTGSTGEFRSTFVSPDSSKIIFLYSILAGEGPITVLDAKTSLRNQLHSFSGEGVNYSIGVPYDNLGIVAGIDVSDGSRAWVSGMNAVEIRAQRFGINSRLKNLKKLQNDDEQMIYFERKGDFKVENLLGGVSFSETVLGNDDKNAASFLAFDWDTGEVNKSFHLSTDSIWGFYPMGDLLGGQLQADEDGSLQFLMRASGSTATTVEINGDSYTPPNFDNPHMLISIPDIFSEAD